MSLGAAGDRLERRGLRARIDLRVAQDGAELRDVANGRGEVVELLLDLGDDPSILGGLVERPRIDPMDDGHP